MSVAQTGAAIARTIESSSGLHEIVMPLLLITTAILTLQLNPFVRVRHREVSLDQGSMDIPARSLGSLHEGFICGLLRLVNTVLNVAFFTESR